MDTEVKFINKSDGTKIKYLSLPYKQGKEYLLSSGYIICPNRNFMVKNSHLVYWNSTMKIWIIG